MTTPIPAVSLFGMSIHKVTLSQAISVLSGWITAEESVCRYVVTPNLDHAVQLQKNEALRSAYASASLVVADGWPIVSASRIFRTPLPERVAGSDLVPQLFETLSAENRPTTVFLLGAAPGVAELAALRIEAQWPAVRVCGTDSPPLGFEHSESECDRIISKINAVNPDILVVGFGAPKQELWLHKHSNRISARVAIAGGATIDFLAGRQTRAPKWMRQIRLEWTHRLITNPRRLSGRYLKNALQLPRLLLMEGVNRRKCEG